MNTLLGDYNVLLAVAIWSFLASGWLMLKKPGYGILYLGPGCWRLRFPSWRAAFGQRLAIVMYPLHSFWPMAEIDLFGDSRANAVSGLTASAGRIARQMRIARWFLMASTGIVAVLIPIRLLLGKTDIVFLVMVVLAYIFYAISLIVLLCSGKPEDRVCLRGYWKVLLEPFLCLPYGAHLCRRLGESYRLSVPLIDILRSGVQLMREDLEDLADHINELKSTCDAGDELDFLDELKTIVDTRLTGLSK